MKKKTATLRMAPRKSEPPDEVRASEDQAKAKRDVAKGGSAGHLPLRSDAVSGKAGRTPETPPRSAKVEKTKPRK